MKQINPALKIMTAIGGWNAGGERFSNMAATPQTRNIFINSLVPFLLNHKLDGFDLDWEFPLAHDRDRLTDLMRVSLGLVG